MSKEKRLKGPWRGVQTAIWLIGLAILAWQDWWWPGILVLVAISVLSQAVIQMAVPGAVEEAAEEAESAEEEAEAMAAPLPPAAGPSAARPGHPTHRLPSECPKCSAPIRGGEARWTGPESADCPYCGANLPLKTET